MFNQRSGSNKRQPTVIRLEQILSDLKKAAMVIKSDLKIQTLFEARPFKELVVAATRSANNRISQERGHEHA